MRMQAVIFRGPRIGNAQRRPIAMMTMPVPWMTVPAKTTSVPVVKVHPLIVMMRMPAPTIPVTLSAVVRMPAMQQITQMNVVWMMPAPRNLSVRARLRVLWVLYLTNRLYASI